MLILWYSLFNSNFFRREKSCLPMQYKHFRTSFLFSEIIPLNKRYKHLESTIEIIEDALNLSKVDMSCSDPRLKNDTESENSYYFPEQ